MTDVVVVWNGGNEILTFDPVQNIACNDFQSLIAITKIKVRWIFVPSGWKYRGNSVIYFAENMTPGVKKL